MITTYLVGLCPAQIGCYRNFGRNMIADDDTPIEMFSARNHYIFLQ